MVPVDYMLLQESWEYYLGIFADKFPCYSPPFPHEKNGIDKVSYPFPGFSSNSYLHVVSFLGVHRREDDCHMSVPL